MPNEIEPSKGLLPSQIEEQIYVVRGLKVMLDADLASLYGVSTKVLNQAVRRNSDRFPADFMFQLTEEETENLRSQFVTSKVGRGGRRYLPYAFTEQGVAMLSSVLRSPRAVEINIEIMRAFVRLRGVLAQHQELAAKIEALEAKYNGQFNTVFSALKMLLATPSGSERRIGLRQDSAPETD